MKKILLLLFVGLTSLAFNACGKSATESEGDNSSSAVSADTTVAPMYEYEEEVPVSLSNNNAEQNSVRIGKKPYVVDFSATWCGPCQQLKPYFEQMEKTYAGKAQFASIDIDQHPQMAEDNYVQAVPTVIIFSDSSMEHELFRVTGFDPEGIEEAILEFI